jgi:hypothetical protein
MINFLQKQHSIRIYNHLINTLFYIINLSQRKSNDNVAQKGPLFLTDPHDSLDVMHEIHSQSGMAKAHTPSIAFTAETKMGYHIIGNDICSFTFDGSGLKGIYIAMYAYKQIGTMDLILLQEAKVPFCR